MTKFSIVLLFLVDVALASSIKDISYDLVVDVGSSGTRFFMNTWHDDESMDFAKLKVDRENEISGGGYSKICASEFFDTPECAAYIAKFREFFNAFKTKAVEAWKAPRVFILGTAGMRQTENVHKKVLWDAVTSLFKNVFPTDYHFTSVDIGDLDPEKEGAYLYWAANYLKGSEGSGNWASLDMGGQSNQLVTSPTVSVSFPLGSDRVFADVFRTDVFNVETGNEARFPTAGPYDRTACLSQKNSTTATFATCAAMIESATNSAGSIKNQVTAVAADKGLTEELWNGLDVLAVSSYYYALKFYKTILGESSLTLTRENIARAADAVCTKSIDQLNDLVAPGGYNKYETPYLQKRCVEATFMYKFLGWLNIPEAKVIYAVKKINGVKLSWSVGVSLETNGLIPYTASTEKNYYYDDENESSLLV